LILCQPVHIFRVLWDLLQQQPVIRIGRNRLYQLLGSWNEPPGRTNIAGLHGSPSHKDESEVDLARSIMLF
jgi:hypothetical protein